MPNDTETNPMPTPATASAPASVPMMAPDGSSVKMVPQDQADAFSAQGAKPVSKMISPEGQQKWVPNDQLDDYKKGGGTLVNGDGSFTVHPLDGESFADTMKRAANAGKAVTPEVIQSQTKKGLKEAPAVLAAAPVMGAAGTAGLAGAGEAILGSPAAYEALKEMVKAHPVAAKALAKFLIGGAMGHEVGHSAKSAILGGLLTSLLK